MSKNKQAGFTIIELLIAMSVFTIVLLLLTGAVVQIGRLYYKGLTMSRTQEAARTVVDDISRSIQYSPGVVKTVPPSGSNQAVCVGLRRYSFVQGQQAKRDANTRVFVSDENPAGCSSNVPLNLATDPSGKALLADGMRVSRLTVTPEPSIGSNAFRVTARIIYGDDDLLCVESGVLSNGATCTNNIGMAAADITNRNDLRCKDVRSGSEFCALSELSTIVERRL